jgi:light-regulated signal transduction histidine kinase (bacteriophytochrome)
MPQMNGIELLRAASAYDPNLVGIMMTGVGTIVTAVEAMQAGALDYILKPFRLLEALPVIARALEVRRLRLHNQRLEQQVRDHAANLEMKNAELEAFSYSVSHDLRAPLRRIEQFSSMLMTDHFKENDPSAQRLLGRIEANTKLMSTLINDLLTLSQINRASLSCQHIDLSAEARQVIDHLQQQEPQRHVEIIITPGLSWEADRGLSRIVLENLIGNAWKYTAKCQHACIEIGRPEGLLTGSWFVRDNGIGLDMKQAERLFQPFQRFVGSEDFPGTGIGLSIVARIMARHRGAIHADSFPGSGTTFTLTINPSDKRQASAALTHQA